MKIKNIIIVIFIISVTIAFNYQLISMKNIDELNYVPDSETAVKVAEAIWLPIYGNKIYKNKPFKAKLISKNVWLISGTMHTEKGGVPYIKLQKSDCRVLEVYHTK